MKKMFGIVIYFLWVFWSTGATYADLIKHTPEMYYKGYLFTKEEQRLSRRHAAGVSVALNLIPLVGPVAMFFATGFYASGWILPGSDPSKKE